MLILMVMVGGWVVFPSTTSFLFYVLGVNPRPVGVGVFLSMMAKVGRIILMSWVILIVFGLGS